MKKTDKKCTSFKEIDLFKRSFNFDKNIAKKAIYLLRESTQHFISLPIEIIREIVDILSFKKTGYYYSIRDTYTYPLKINNYLGKIVEKHNGLAEVSYNGWTDDFNETVTLKYLSYLTEKDMPRYYIGSYLDIKSLLDNKWFVGLIWDIKFVNDEQFLTILYKIKDEKKLMIAKNVPIYYKYMCPVSRHTKHWPSVYPTDYKHYLTKIPITQRPIQWARHLAVMKNYDTHEYSPL